MNRHRGPCLLPVVLLCLVVPASSGWAQLEDNLGAYSGDTAEGYLKPLQEAFGQALNSNFFTDAAIAKNQVHARLDIRAMSVFFGSDDETFTATTGDGFTTSQAVEAPTVVGSTESVAYTDPQSGTQFVFPGGFDLKSLTVGVPQITVSGFRGTEATVRWIAFDTGDAEIGNISLFGFGVRHNVSQYLVDFPLEVAGAVYYQSFKLGDDLVDAKAFSIGLQGSKSFGVLRPFGGVSFDSFSMDATYTTNTGDQDEETTLKMDTATTLHLTAGGALDLGPVAAHIAADLGQRFGVSAGLGFGF